MRIQRIHSDIEKKHKNKKTVFAWSFIYDISVELHEPTVKSSVSMVMQMQLLLKYTEKSLGNTLHMKWI